jgi:hypothetical protein
MPNATLTTSGPTHIEDANGLTIAADATGTGSFIDNGTITYGLNGSATVQQYFTDNVANVTFHNHFVGPMVTDPTFETDNGGTKGVYLQDFNLAALSSYAYEFDPTANDWVNIFAPTNPVPTTKGITLSTNTDQNYTLSQTGRLINGTISTANGSTISGVGYNLISNPFTCGINLSNFLLVNSAFGGSIGTTVYVWEGSNNVDGGNYSSYILFGAGTGGLTSGVLKIGQGFFVSSNAGAAVNFASNSSFPEKNS